MGEDYKACQGITCHTVARWVWLWGNQATALPRCPTTLLSCGTALPCVPTSLDTPTTQRCHHGRGLRRTRAGKAASDVSERCASPAPIFTWERSAGQNTLVRTEGVARPLIPDSLHGRPSEGEAQAKGSRGECLLEAQSTPPPLFLFSISPNWPASHPERRGETVSEKKERRQGENEEEMARAKTTTKLDQRRTIESQCQQQRDP
ncbi:hypothetical protein Q8A67_010887 [Cirrhinus molitorella]|uniref:Uncharacterized protein n=1 Tax=Cirrhinus molitorella TaxID=172907 RepID=A0AA88PQ67_9TELE|nr:hypothetical protein Q8A67_010887 [Cirrhinus molitorella]